MSLMNRLPTIFGSTAKLDETLPNLIQVQQTDNAIRILPIQLHHIYALSGLEAHADYPVRIFW